MPDIFTNPQQWEAQPTGAPYPGALKYFYQAGTLVAQTVYQDAGLVTPHAQPVTADDGGKFPVIYLDPNAAADYRVITNTSTGVRISDLDNIPKTSVTLTSNSIAQILNDHKRTQLEIDNGITPTDYSYRNTPKRYGAIGDNVTDDVAALQKWMLCCGHDGYLDAIYRCSDRLTGPLNVSIDGLGPELAGINFTGGAGAFSGNQAFSLSQGFLAALPRLASDVAAGDTQVRINAHTLVDGDWFRLYNSTAWNNALSTFTKGEYCRVLEVIDANTLRLTKPLDDSYVALTTDVAKCNYGTAVLKNFSITGVSADSAVIPLFGDSLKRVRIENVTVEKSALTAATFRNTFNVKGTGVVCQQGYEGTEQGTQQYGISWIHCQDVDVSGTFQGERHGWTTGSTTGGGVVNRRVICRDSTCISSIDMACDNHGNSEYCGFENVTAIGGVALGGDHGFFHGRSIGHEDIQQGQVFRFREMLGCSFDIDIDGYTLADPSTGTPGTTGVFDMGRDGSAFSANTTRDGTMKAVGKIVAPNSLIGARLINNGSTAQCKVIYWIDMQINAATSTANGLIRLDKNSGDNFQSLDLRGMTGTEGLTRSLINMNVDTIVADYLPLTTYTPVLAFGGASTNITYGAQVGWFQINGNMCKGGGRVLLTSKGGGAATGNATISLPRAVLNQTGASFPVTLNMNVVTFADWPSGLALANTSTFQLFESTNAGVRTSLTDADFANTSEVYFWFEYPFSY